MATQTNLEVVISGDSSGVTKAFNALSKQADKAQSSLKKSFANMTQAGGMVATGFGAIGVAIGGMGVYGVKAAADIETLKTSLVTAMGGSQEAADKAFATIEKFAKETPFEMNEVVDSFVKLKNMGLDPSERALTSYGDTASAMGKSLNQMIEAVADAATGEFERLKEFGIKTKSEGDKVSFTFKGVTKTVGKNSKEIEDYLINLGETEFTGGMLAQSKTLNGMMSTLKDTFSIAMAKIVKDAGIFDKIKKLVGKLTATLENLDIDAIFAKVSASFNNAKTAITNFWGTVQPILQPMIDKFKEFFSEVENRKAALFAFFTTLTTLMTAWAISTAVAMAPVVLTIGALMLISGALYKAWTSNFMGIQEKTSQAFQYIVGVYNQYIVPLWGIMKAKLLEHEAYFIAVWENIKQMFGGVWTAIIGIFQIAWATLTGLVKIALAIFTGDWSKAWDLVGETFAKQMDGLVVVFDGVWEAMKGTFKLAINFIIGGINKLIRAAAKIKIPSWAGGDGSALLNVSEIPQMATGTNNVPQDMIAQLHEGEAVIPKKYNNNNQGGTVINVNINGGTYLDRNAGQKLAELLDQNLRLRARV